MIPIFLGAFTTESSENALLACLSQSNSLRTTEQIFLKFDIGDFYEHLLTYSSFG
jgi:hypothetical protein